MKTSLSIVDMASPLIGEPTHVDGSYVCDGSTGSGTALRDHSGAVVFVAYRQLLDGVDGVDP